jgi:hypothetical protein
MQGRECLFGTDVAEMKRGRLAAAPSSTWGD